MGKKKPRNSNREPYTGKLITDHTPPAVDFYGRPIGQLDPNLVQLHFTAAAFAGLIAKEGLERAILRTGAAKDGMPSPCTSLEAAHFEKAYKVGQRVAKMYLGRAT